MVITVANSIFKIINNITNTHFALWMNTLENMSHRNTIYYKYLDFHLVNNLLCRIQRIFRASTVITLYFILAGSVCSHRQVRERRQLGFVASRRGRSTARPFQFVNPSTYKKCHSSTQTSPKERLNLFSHNESN